MPRLAVTQVWCRKTSLPRHWNGGRPAMIREQGRVVQHDPVAWVIKHARTLSDTRLARLAVSPHAEAIREVASNELTRRARRRGNPTNDPPMHRIEGVPQP